MTQPSPSPAPSPGPTTQPEEATNILAQSAAAGRPDSTGLTSAEEQQLIDLQAKAMAARQGKGGTTDLRIKSDHAQVSYGNHSVTRDWTPTPTWLVAPFVSAAAESGVEIEQKES